MLRTFGRPTLNHQGELFEPEVSQGIFHCDANTRLAVFSDGLFDTNFKPSQLATLIHQGAAGEVVYKCGSKDDISTAVASKLDKLPVGKGIALIGIDANGKHGTELAKRAMQLLSENLQLALNPKKSADAKVGYTAAAAGGATAAGATAAAGTAPLSAGQAEPMTDKKQIPLVVNAQLLERGVVIASVPLASKAGAPPAAAETADVNVSNQATVASASAK